MPHLLFNLQHVSDDEADEVRELLEHHNINFYETHAGRWRIGLAGIWLPNAEQKDEALSLLSEYQRQRLIKAQDERQRLQEQGLLMSFMENLQRNPLKVFVAMLGILAVLALSLLPFFSAFINE